VATANVSAVRLRFRSDEDRRAITLESIRADTNLSKLSLSNVRSNVRER
jgi:hypothetical protein